MQTRYSCIPLISNHTCALDDLEVTFFTPLLDDYPGKGHVAARPHILGEQQRTVIIWALGSTS
jgi:hypothetical protein